LPEVGRDSVAGVECKLLSVVPDVVSPGVSFVMIEVLVVTILPGAAIQEGSVASGLQTPRLGDGPSVATSLVDCPGMILWPLASGETPGVLGNPIEETDMVLLGGPEAPPVGVLPFEGDSGIDGLELDNSICSEIEVAGCSGSVDVLWLTSGGVLGVLLITVGLDSKGAGVTSLDDEDVVGLTCPGATPLTPPGEVEIVMVCELCSSGDGDEAMAVEGFIEIWGVLGRLGLVSWLPESQDEGAEICGLDVIPSGAAGLVFVVTSSSGKLPSGRVVRTARSVTILLLSPGVGKTMKGVVMQVMATPPIFSSPMPGGDIVGLGSSGPTLAHPKASPSGL